jgi:hypothetical protein
LKEAGVQAHNLSELELLLGRFTGALEYAGQSVIYADRSGNAPDSVDSRAIRADALHQAGHRAEAEAGFREAEEMEARLNRNYPLLYSVRGFRYCDLLLAVPERAAWHCMLEITQGERASVTQSCRAVARRAEQTLRWHTEDNRSPLAIALDHLTLGRAALYEAILEGSSLESCCSSLKHAIDGLRRLGTMHHLPYGLLTRAWLRSLSGASIGAESAQRDLDEASEIAERGPMPLLLADIHLHRARLFGGPKSQVSGEKYPWESPAADLAAARRLIEKHGYLRRLGELEDAEAAASNWPRFME